MSVHDCYLVVEDFLEAGSRGDLAEVKRIYERYECYRSDLLVGWKSSNTWWKRVVQTSMKQTLMVIHRCTLRAGVCSWKSSNTWWKPMVRTFTR
jgi:hypothetical protein